MFDSTSAAVAALSRNEFAPTGTHFLLLPPVLHMKRRGRLANARLAYETWGTLSEGRDNAILILTGMSPNAHAAASPKDPAPGWWEGMVGPGKPIDSNRWFVICVNSLGSCKGSTGAASTAPHGKEPYRLDFPELSIEDVADAAAFSIRSLGIETLGCVIGCSMGGMTALSLLARHPGLGRARINISSAVHALPFALAVRSLQREAIRQDPNWQNGHYSDDRFPLAGMTLARKLGLITYRSAQERQARFGRALRAARETERPSAAPHEPEFAVESNMVKHARRFLRSFDPNAYLYLSHCIDRFDLGDEAEGCADLALSRLGIEQALVLGAGSDILFPLFQQRQIAEGLRAGGARTRFAAFDCHQGHDSFLVDVAAFGAPMADFLTALLPRPRQRPARPRACS